MTSLIRTYIGKTIFGTKREMLINLKHVSSIDLKKNTVRLNMATENDGFFGNFIFMIGNSTSYRNIHCETKKEAEQEFNEIKNILEQYYKIPTQYMKKSE